MRYHKPKKRNPKNRSRLLINILIVSAFIGLGYGFWHLGKAAYSFWQRQPRHLAQIHIHPSHSPNIHASSNQASSFYWIHSQCLPSKLSSKTINQSWQSHTQDSATKQLHIHHEKPCTQLQFGPYPYLSQTRQAELFLDQLGLSYTIHTRR